MKISFISINYNPELGGGAAKVVFNLANSLSDLGHEITVITSTNRKSEGVIYENGIKIVKLFPPNIYWINDKDRQPFYKKALFQLIDLWNPLVKNKILKILLSNPPEILHIHKLRGFSPSVWDAARKANTTKIIQSCHDFELISPQGLLQGKIGEMAINRNFPINIYQKLRANNSNNVTDAIAPSKIIMNKHLEFGFFLNSKKHVIPHSHGYSLRQLQINLQESKPVVEEPILKVLFIGRLVEEKGIDILCKVVGELEHKGHKIFLDIIGSGQIEKSLNDKYFKSKQIQFYGSIFSENKTKILAKCDILVVPSLVPESFGIVIVEAFAYGKPVICSKIGALPEIVIDNFNGFLFEAGNQDQLKSLLLNICYNKKLLTGMRENCFSSAEGYCSDVILDKYLSVYEN